MFQWRYIAGNSWGRCDNGTEAVGCGPQEEFRACADVAIDGPGARPQPIPYPTPPSSGADDEDEYEGKGEVEEDGSVVPGVAEEQLGRALWTALVTALGAALAAATALLLLYVYYYHAADVLKRWLLARRVRMSAAASA